MIRYLVGDIRDRLAELADGSVDLVASSPPFLALRSYLPPDHESKHAEIGSEANPAMFLDTLLALTAEWGRVLAPHGSLAIELGDTYSGSGGAGGDYNDDGLRDGQQKFNGSASRTRSSGWHRSGNEDVDRYRSTGAAFTAPNGGTGWPQAKSLALIPQLYAIALAYGINPLTGQPSPAGRWRVRNVIVWHRPNPAVGALGDKFRPSTSYIVVATRSAKRWFDLTAVRGDHKSDPEKFTGNGYTKGCPQGDGDPVMKGNPAGAPPLDCWKDTYDEHDTWTLTTQPSSLAHYAMWPAKLAERLVLSMCPQSVCRVCGEPRRRVEGKTPEYAAIGRGWADLADGRGKANGRERNNRWTDCGHDDYRPGVVLEPFAGTGTTLAVADLHGRDAIGIDIDQRNHDLYPRRHDEVKRSLFGTKPEVPGQGDLFAEVDA